MKAGDDAALLAAQGFVLWKNVLPPADVQEAQAAIEPTRVNYARILPYVQQTLLGTVNRQLGWQAVLTKYRVSDNNNSADASAFHRDVACHHPDQTLFPLYTCLSYLDATIVELIPGTHLRPVMGWGEAWRTYGQAQRLEVQPGDVLLFHAGLIHRGIFTEGLARRRLIQVFEVYPSQNAADTYRPRVLHLYNKTNQRAGTGLAWLSRHAWAFGLVNWMGYANAATGYGYVHRPLQRAGLTPYEYCSSEGTQARLQRVDPEGWGAINVYVLHQPVPSSAQDETHLQFWQYHCQTLWFCGVLLAVIVFCGWVLYRAWKVFAPSHAVSSQKVNRAQRRNL